MIHGKNENIHIPINEINHSTNYQQFPKSFFQISPFPSFK